VERRRRSRAFQTVQPPSSSTTAKCAGLLSTLDGMTTRERLHRLVDDLSDDQAAAALALLENQLSDDPQPDALPEFFGMLHSGKGDLAARSDEILRAEFGRR
jgi:hypothetical protein